MPYFPSAPGGSVLLPNTIDDAMLVDMPAGTVKGRAVGAGTGDPQNLTSTQLALLTGIPLGQCRLAYVSPSIVRLSPYNGNLLTIDNQLQVIPAAGVDLAATGLTAGALYYIYAFMTGGVMSLSANTGTPATDARNGIQVSSVNAAATLVGMLRCAVAATFVFTASQLFVRSWFNDPGLDGRNFLSANVQYNGSTFANLSGPANIEALLWAGEVGHATITGNVMWATTNTLIYTAIGIDVATAEEGADLKQTNAANFQQSIHCHANFGPTRGLTEGYHMWLILGATSIAGSNTVWSGGGPGANGRCTLFLSTRGRGR
jgi:hypothetical protein